MKVKYKNTIKKITAVTMMPIIHQYHKIYKSYVRTHKNVLYYI